MDSIEERDFQPAVHIVPELSEGTWLSSLNVMHFFGSSGAKDQLPGH